nr:hypothetical protein [uncultured Lichenicoccus sp.]
MPGSGRKRGTPNKATIAKAQALVTAAGAVDIRLTDAVLARLDACDVMAHLMRTALRAGQAAFALDCARSLAPYVAPKLQAITMTNTIKRTFDDYSDAELQEVIDGKLDVPDAVLEDANARDAQTVEDDIERARRDLDRALRRRDEVATTPRQSED